MGYYNESVVIPVCEKLVMSDHFNRPIDLPEVKNITVNQIYSHDLYIPECEILNAPYAEYIMTFGCEPTRMKKGVTPGQNIKVGSNIKEIICGDDTILIGYSAKT